MAVACFLAATPAFAQVSALAAVNGASFANSALPNGKLAPGVLFTVFGTGMGPESLIENASFPLAQELSGTSVAVTVGGVTVNCPMIFTSDKQIAAILPSSVSAGSGTLTVRYNSQASSPLPVEVVPHSFGIFSVSQSGFGQGVLTNPFTAAANSLVTSANPGQILDIWGTGIGAVDGDESAGPLPGDIPSLDVQVLVGDIPAEVLYRGRSGCCAGVDQIRFVVPPGINGCYVPLRVFVDGVRSNDVSASVAASGPYCDSPGGLTAADLQTAVQTGTLRQGLAVLSRSLYEGGLPYPRYDYAEVSFRQHSLDDLLRIGVFPYSPRIGACTVGQSLLTGFLIVGFLAEFDLGTVTLNGPPGSFPMHNIGFLAPSEIQNLSFVPGYEEDQEGLIRDGTVLTAGSYTFSSTGGSYQGPLPVANIPPFTLSLTLPELLDWTNRDSISEIDRTQPLTLTWANGVPGGWVGILGSSVFVGGGGQLASTGFGCWADAAAGSFTVPAEILSLLPSSAETMYADSNSLGITQWIFEPRFTLPGIDVGRVVSVDSIYKSVRFR